MGSQVAPTSSEAYKEFFKTFGIEKPYDLTQSCFLDKDIKNAVIDTRKRVANIDEYEAANAAIGLREIKDKPFRAAVYKAIAGNDEYISYDETKSALEKAGLLKLPNDQGDNCDSNKAEGFIIREDRPQIGPKDFKEFFETFGIKKSYDLTHSQLPGTALREAVADARKQIANFDRFEAKSICFGETRDKPVRFSVLTAIGNKDVDRQCASSYEIATALETAGLLKLPANLTVPKLWGDTDSLLWATSNIDNGMAVLNELADYLNAHEMTDDIRRAVLKTTEDSLKSLKTKYPHGILGFTELSGHFLSSTDPDIRERTLNLLADEFMFSLSTNDWRGCDKMNLCTPGFSKSLNEQMIGNLNRSDVPAIKKMITSDNPKKVAFALLLAGHVMNDKEFSSSKNYVANWHPKAGDFLYYVENNAVILSQFADAITLAKTNKFVGDISVPAIASR